MLYLWLLLFQQAHDGVLQTLPCSCKAASCETARRAIFAQAKRFVYSQLSNSYTFDYTLQTKVNREYASGIAVRFTGDFYEFEDFNMAMIDIMRFYRDEAARLKNALAMTRRTDSDVTIREEAA